MVLSLTAAAAAVRARPALVDALVATGLLAVVMLGLSVPVPAGSGLAQADAPAYLLSVVGIAPYYWRSRFPLPVLVLASLPVVALVALGYSTGALGVGLFLLLFTVAAHSDRIGAALGAGWAVVVLAAVAVADSARITPVELATNGLLLAGAFVLGRWARERRRHVGWVEERAALLERDQELAEQRAVAEERVRIAQELHDVVGHSLGVIAVQAGVARHVIDTEPEEAKASLEAIAATSRSSLAEIRRILVALRTTPQGDPGYVPTPGSGQVPALVAQLRAAGLRVTLEVVGRPESVPVGVDLAVYRIVQESLTNVLTHAPGAAATVALRWCPAAVEVDIADDGSEVPGTAVRDGHRGLGLLGMRERVQAFGGSLACGPTQAGGFEVRARIPWGEAAP